MQSKLVSLIEQVMNVGSGFIFSLFIWLFIITPIFGIDMQFSENLSIVLIFTVASILRGYFWRRVFNSHCIAYWIEERIIFLQDWFTEKTN